MKRVLFVVLALLLVLAGCITIDMGGSSSKAPEIVKFEVNPISINSGGAAILSWEVSNASSVSIDPDIGKDSLKRLGKSGAGGYNYLYHHGQQ